MIKLVPSFVMVGVGLMGAINSDLLGEDKNVYSVLIGVRTDLMQSSTKASFIGGEVGNFLLSYYSSIYLLALSIMHQSQIICLRKLGVLSI